jgi:branched-subunit amino acid transport protein
MLWLIIVSMAVVTFAMRISFIATVKPHAIPEAIRGVLAYVAPAVLAAIVVPPILVRGDAVDLSPDNPRLIAAAVAFAIAWFTKSVVGSIVGGMATLWLAQWILGA